MEYQEAVEPKETVAPPPAAPAATVNTTEQITGGDVVSAPLSPESKKEKKKKKHKKHKHHSSGMEGDEEPKKLKLVFKLSKATEEQPKWSISSAASAPTTSTHEVTAEAPPSTSVTPSTTEQTTPSITTPSSEDGGGSTQSSTSATSLGLKIKIKTPIAPPQSTPTSPTASNKRKEPEPSEVSSSTEKKHKPFTFKLGQNSTNAPTHKSKKAKVDSSNAEIDIISTNGTPAPPKPEPKGFLPFRKVLNNILKQLIKKDTGGYYFYPVTEEEAPDYFSIISHPMDFSTMRKKLDEGAYLGLDAFQRDLELIWKNAMTYNPKDSVYYQEAKKLKALSRDIIASYSKRIDPSKLTSPEAAAGVEPPSSAAKSSTSSSGGGGGEGDLVKLPKSNGAVVKRTSLPVKALDTPDPVKHASVDNRPAAGYSMYVPKFAQQQQQGATQGQQSGILSNSITAMSTAAFNQFAINYVSNYLNYCTKPAVSAPTVPKMEISEHSYTSSLEAFVKSMDNSALESVVKFTKSLRNPQPPVIPPLTISSDLLDTLHAHQQQHPTHSHKHEDGKSTTTACEVCDGVVSWDAVLELTTLAKEGIDLSFLERVEPSLKGFFCKTEEEQNEFTKKIQEQLDRNFHMLYVLQISQYERSTQTPSELENRIAAQLAQSISELCAKVPPSILFTADGLHAALNQFLEDSAS